MTVSYSGDVPNGSSFGVFWNVLFKWRGSVYKIVWRELVVYLAMYYAINFLVRFGLNDDQKRIFIDFRKYFTTQAEIIPISFVLAFYVSLVVNRWWEQFTLLPFPDALAILIGTSTSETTAEKKVMGRLMRRNVMRYIVLAFVILLMKISLRVKKRFPSWQHVVDAGFRVSRECVLAWICLLLENEKSIFEKMEKKSSKSEFWVPLVWAANIVSTARKQGLITSDFIVQNFFTELCAFRQKLGGLIAHDTVCVPLVYTQVVTLVLYSYFLVALLGRQMIPNVDTNDGQMVPNAGAKDEADLYFPLVTVLQFVFYVGWLKVAEVLINPFGEDDDDFNLNWLIDRHLKVSYTIVDEMHDEYPELLRDQYWDEVVPKSLPYTVGSAHDRKSEPKGSAEKYKVKPEDALYAKGGQNAPPTTESIQNMPLDSSQSTVVNVIISKMLSEAMNDEVGRPLTHQGSSASSVQKTGENP